VQREAKRKWEEFYGKKDLLASNLAELRVELTEYPKEK
jgi:hypothetical protein